MKEHGAISVLNCASHFWVYFAFGVRTGERIFLIYKMFISPYDKLILSLYKANLPDVPI